MEASLLQQFERLITAHTGLHVREQERALLQKSLIARLQSLKLADADEYFELLQSAGARSEAEWKHLSALITNQESYFFRDQGQFALLRHEILPALIERNQKHRSLRLWSAGCSTGQEIYSLAILVDLLLPFRTDWNIFILGTDLSEAALEKARRGLYSSWSFRAMEPELQQRYFKRRQHEYEMDKRIRDSVVFRHGNLLHDRFPSAESGIHDIDLIVCRNVFIYFKREAVATVLTKFNQTLREQGYLLTGHAELHDTPLADLRPRTFPQTIIYQRIAQPTPQENGRSHPTSPESLQRPAAVMPPFQGGSTPPSTAISTQAAPLRNASAPLQSALVPSPVRNSAAPGQTPIAALDEASQVIEEVLALLRLGKTAVPLAKLLSLLRAEPSHCAAHCLAAQAHANAARYEEAMQHCRRATEVEPFAPLPFHILARIAEERGERAEAKALLKKVIYLAPSLALPYFELSSIYEHEGDQGRARKMRDTAAQLLDKLSQDEPVPTHPLSVDRPITVGELRQYLQERAKVQSKVAT